jgi:hypothetical protein
MKSTSACDLIAIRGLKSMLRARSSTAHLSLDWVGVVVFLPLDNNGSTDHVNSHNEVEQ